MMKVSDITDIWLANYIGVKETKTFRNWKKLEDPNIIPTTGKYILYKAARTYAYLHCKKYEEEEEYYYSNFEILQSSFKIIENKLNMDNLSIEEKKVFEVAKEILENINNI